MLNVLQGAFRKGKVIFNVLNVRKELTENDKIQTLGGGVVDFYE